MILWKSTWRADSPPIQTATPAGRTHSRRGPVVCWAASAPHGREAALFRLITSYRSTGGCIDKKKSSSATIALLLKVDLEGFEPLTSRMRTERSPSNIAFVHTSHTVRKKNQRVFVHIKRSAIPIAFCWNKYSIQTADFQDEAVWGVIWLADK